MYWGARRDGSVLPLFIYMYIRWGVLALSGAGLRWAGRSRVGPRGRVCKEKERDKVGCAFVAYGRAWRACVGPGVLSYEGMALPGAGGDGGEAA